MTLHACCGVNEPEMMETLTPKVFSVWNGDFGRCLGINNAPRVGSMMVLVALCEKQDDLGCLYPTMCQLCQLRVQPRTLQMQCCARDSPDSHPRKACILAS